MTIGWAVLGTGRHVERCVAPAIRGAEGARFVAVLSRDKDRAQQFASSQGAARGYAELDQLLADPEIQAIYIATPNNLHKEQTLRAAAAGKHVLCEKPMATSSEDARAMVEGCRHSGVKLGIGFHLRHHEANVEARRIFESGEIGSPVLVRAQWSYAGVRGGWWAAPEETGWGILAAVGVHIVDLMRYLLKQEIREVSAFAATSPDVPGIDETVAATLRFESGALGVLTCSRQTPKGDNDFAFFGSGGRMDGLGIVSQSSNGKLIVSTSDGSRELSFDALEPYTVEIEAFQRAVIGNTEPDASGLDGLRSIEVLDALVRSYREGRAVSPGEVV